jgi:hypothetical protein
MSTERRTPADLERLVSRALAEQPLRQAPRDLTARVLAEIERRAARAWWRRGFAHWPAAARVGFVAACGSLAAAMVVALTLHPSAAPGSSLARLAGPLVARVHAPGEALFTLAQALGLAARSIPREWLFGGLALAAFAYGIVFLAAGAAYRLCTSPIGPEVSRT